LTTSKAATQYVRSRAIDVILLLFVEFSAITEKWWQKWGAARNRIIMDCRLLSYLFLNFEPSAPFNGAITAFMFYNSSSLITR
jgi:hypothetical protein